MIQLLTKILHNTFTTYNVLSPLTAYFVTGQTLHRKQWIVNILYETELESLNFTPSDECINIKFVDETDTKDMKVLSTVNKLAKMFNPNNH